MGLVQLVYGYADDGMDVDVNVDVNTSAKDESRGIAHSIFEQVLGCG